MARITAALKKIVEENPVAFATVNPDGTPNVIGVACVKVVSKGMILVTDNYMKQTKRNIQKNNNVCLAVWDKRWDGYKIVGAAEYHSEGKWGKYVCCMPENKGMPAKGAILIKPKRIKKLG